MDFQRPVNPSNFTLPTCVPVSRSGCAPGPHPPREARLSRLSRLSTFSTGWRPRALGRFSAVCPVSEHPQKAQLDHLDHLDQEDHRDQSVVSNFKLHSSNFLRLDRRPTDDPTVRMSNRSRPIRSGPHPGVFACLQSQMRRRHPSNHRELRGASTLRHVSPECPVASFSSGSQCPPSGLETESRTGALRR